MFLEYSEYNVRVPHTLAVSGGEIGGKIELSKCNTQNEVKDYLKICVWLGIARAWKKGEEIIP